ncbi:nitrogen fixation protein NifR [Staphylococcus aureus]|nr:nitrogen fixation protein NifR [Staphylococcus aureus]
MQVGVGPQHSEIGFPISTGNGSWRGPNIEAGGKSAYNNVQVGVGQRNKFYKISFLSHSYSQFYLNI